MQIVTVNFRDIYKREFTNGPYAYLCDIEVNVGDLVLVETRFGYSLGQIVAVNQRLTKGNVADLKSVIKIVMTNEELAKETHDEQN